MQGVPLSRSPSSLKRVRALDPVLADELESDIGRLVQAGSAVAWAQERLPRLVQAGSATGVLRVLVEEARALTGVPGAWALSWSGSIDRPSVEALAVSGETPVIRAMPTPEAISKTIVGQVIHDGRPAWSDDALADQRFGGVESVQAIQVRSVGCLPVGTAGVLYLHDPERPGRFDGVSKARLSALCALAAPFLEPGDAATPARPREGSPPPIPGLVGDAPAMDELRFAITAFAPMPWPALILGETGTGKELVARSLHDLSPQSGQPFVAVNCGAIPETLAESTLFGHERGAFTGADRQRPGVVERVDEGTLFLDEVGELPAPIQVKLLRLLQERTYERVGGDRERAFRGRIVAATHRQVDQPDERGGFREDLYHRLGACVLRVPPLQDRRGDIPSLAEHLLQRALQELTGSPSLSLAPETLVALRRRDWPGNVRELENAVRTSLAHAIARGEAVIRPEHLAPGPHGDTETEGLLPELPVDLAVATEGFQRRLVEAALAEAGDHKTRAAELLGVSRQWLHRLTSRWKDDG